MIEKLTLQLVFCAVALVTSNPIPPTSIPMEGCLHREIDENRPVFLADPTNCSRFYICNGGDAYLMPCPDGLYFNLNLKVCDFPFRSGCVPPEVSPIPAQLTTEGEQDEREISSETSPTAAQLITIEVPVDQLDDSSDEDGNSDEDSDAEENDNDEIDEEENGDSDAEENENDNGSDEDKSYSENSDVDEN